LVGKAAESVALKNLDGGRKSPIFMDDEVSDRSLINAHVVRVEVKRINLSFSSRIHKTPIVSGRRAFWRYPERERRIDGDDSGTIGSAARMHGAGGADRMPGVAVHRTPGSARFFSDYPPTASPAVSRPW
jgi:hypothetical protein